MQERYKWIVCPPTPNQPRGKTHHQATVHNNILYVWGGNDTTLYCYHLLNCKWFLPKVTGCVINHVPGDLYGFVSFSSSTSNHQKWFIFSHGYGFRSFKFDTLCWSMEYYDELDINCPKSRIKDTLVCRNDTLIYMFGGYVVDLHTFSNEMFEYHIEKQIWRSVNQNGIVPTGRYCHTAVVYNDSMFILGGYNGETKLSDLHEFQFSSFRWQQIDTQTKLSGMLKHSANVYGHKMIVFDGSCEDNCLYEFDFLVRDWKIIKLKNDHVKRNDFAAVIYKGYLFVIGGLITNVDTRNEIVKVYLGYENGFLENLMKTLATNSFIDVKLLCTEPEL